MIRRTANNLEEFIGQVLSLNTPGIPGHLGNVLIEVNPDGSTKVNEHNEINIVGAYPESLLFRGQNNDYSLIPKIARYSPHRTEILERSLIGEIKRRGDKLVKNGQLDNWELLVYVQHFGLATRLLDWTTNPLIALWFACQSSNNDLDAYIYILKYSEFNLVDTEKDKSPFKIYKTKILKPNLNNDRIIAQNGWFTVHSLKNKQNRIIPLDEEDEFRNIIWQIRIPAIARFEILGKLNILGINYETIYPGIEGTCCYINWMNNIK